MNHRKIFQLNAIVVGTWKSRINTLNGKYVL